MSLVSYINRSCPVGVGHYHGPSPKQRPYRTQCCLCTDNLDRQNFCWFCPDYCNETEIKLNRDQLFVLHLIFSRENLWLPIEIRDIIFKKSIFIRKTKIPIRFNEKGIDHIYECRKCSRKFLEYLEKKSCSNHIIPRISRRNELYD